MKPRTIQWTAAALSFSATWTLIWVGISALSVTVYGPGVPAVLAKALAAYEAGKPGAATTATVGVFA